MQLLRRWALATFILTFLVIIAGGVVRTTQSGMGCPDWPKCFGQYIPPTKMDQVLFAANRQYSKGQFIRYNDSLWFAKTNFVSNAQFDTSDWNHYKKHGYTKIVIYQTWIEFTNRLLGALLGLFALIQFVLAFKKRQINRKAFSSAVLVLALVIATGLFGALVVRYNLAHLSISVHLAFAVAMVLTQLALLLHIKHKAGSCIISASQKKWFYFFLVALLFQFVLGTLVRMYVDDVSKELDYIQREKWLQALPLVFIIHRTFSWVLLAMAIFMVYKTKQTAIYKQTLLLLALVIANAVAGIILFYANMPAAVQPLHLLLGTVCVAQVVRILLLAKMGKQQ